MKVSLTIPVYKAEAFIERSAESLFGQTHEDMEYIFIDDFSPDESIARLKKTLEKYPSRASQVTIVKLNESKGPGEARKLGLSKATGAYVGFCDSDDWLDIDYVEKMVKKAEEANADIVYCPIVREYPNGKRLELRINEYNSAKELLLNSCPSVLFNSMCNKLIRREIAQNPAIEVLEGVSIGEDLFYITQVAKLSNTVAYVEKVVYHYRQNYGSITQKGLGRKRAEDLLAVTEKLEAKLPEKEFSKLRDRLRRDVLAAAFTARTYRDRRFRALRHRLESPLNDEPRYGFIKRMILTIVDIVVETFLWW